MRPDALMTIVRDVSVIATGESTDPLANAQPDTPSGIEILSFGHKISTRENQLGVQGASNAVHGPIRIVKPVDNASPKIQDLVEQAYTDLVIFVGIMYRKGTSAQASDQWDRDVLLDYEFKQARITSVKVVLDPRVHPIANTMWTSDDLDVGPLEEIVVEYKDYEFSYGSGGNKVTWTYQAGGQ